MAVTDDDLMNIIIAFSVICSFLFIICVILIVAVGFIISKLKQHEQAIAELEDRERKLMQHSKGNIVGDGIKDNEYKQGNANSDNWGCTSNDVQLRHTTRKTGSYHARMTVFIEKETVNVYGNKAPTGQLISIAQNFYKEETNTDINVPAEFIDIVDKTANMREARSMIFTNDWMGGDVPTSFLFNGGTQSIENIVTQNKGIFIHKTVGPEGKTLTISGVTLTIPPNAIRERTLISVGILWDENFVPKLRKKQTLLSPLVLCQPSRLTFDRPVTLSFPHAAVDVEDDWKTKIIKRDGNLEENTDWSELAEFDCSSSAIDTSHVVLQINHFTLYTCVGESNSGKVAKKGVQIVAFAGSLAQGEFFKPRIYCLNKYKEDIEDVKHVEKDIDEKSKVRETTTLIVHDNDQDVMVELADLMEGWKVLGNKTEDVKHVEKDIDEKSKVRETTTLIVHDNDQDVMVELADLMEGWKVLGNKTECIQFEQIWHSMQPHCTFIIEPMKKVTEIRSEFYVYQNGRENFAATLKIAEKMTISNVELHEEDPLSELLNELIVLLDPENVIGSDAGNWRDLAEKMGCGLARIRWLKSQGSPTKVLFRKWIDEEKRSLVELEQILRDINRPDAADEVKRRLSSHDQPQTRV